MNGLSPFETVIQDLRPVRRIALPSELEALYGGLAFPPHPGRPYIVGNFVSTLDGVVTLGDPGHASGSAISGRNAHDRLLMALLRAVADIVIVAAGTLRVEPKHIWTATSLAPQYAATFAECRTLLGKPATPLTVFVTASGNIDLSLPAFQSGETEVCIAANEVAATALRSQPLPSHVQLLELSGEGRVSVREVLSTVQKIRPGEVVLTEGGPHLLGGFLAEHCLDELFLTLAPQVAGRDDPAKRPGFVSGQEFAPQQPLWSTLVDVRRAGSFLFLRYAFEV